MSTTVDILCVYWYLYNQLLTLVPLGLYIYSFKHILSKKFVPEKWMKFFVVDS